MRLVIMGTPGAGKGTQAGLLAARTGACHISTGDVLRDAVRRGSPFGREAQRHMERGRLVPDDVVIGIVAERLAGGKCKRGFLLDGFPRTVAQARALDEMLAGRGEPLDAALVISVPRDEVVRRVAGRRVCAACGAVSDVGAEPAHTEGCQGTLVQRDDDREETVRHRLDVYARETAGVLEHYRHAGLLREVDGSGTRKEVSRRIEAALR